MPINSRYCVILVLLHACLTESTMDRTEAITRHTITELARRYGDKRMDAWMLSSVARVCLSFSRVYLPSGPPFLQELVGPSLELANISNRKTKTSSSPCLTPRGAVYTTRSSQDLYIRYARSNTKLQVKHGVMFDRRETEGTKRRHQVDTVVEGMYVYPFPTTRSIDLTT